MYTKADKKRFGLCDQNLKIRKEPFRSFYDRGNMSLFFSRSAIQFTHHSATRWDLNSMASPTAQRPETLCQALVLSVVLTDWPCFLILIHCKKER